MCSSAEAVCVHLLKRDGLYLRVCVNPTSLAPMRANSYYFYHVLFLSTILCTERNNKSFKFKIILQSTRIYRSNKIFHISALSWDFWHSYFGARYLPTGKHKLNKASTLWTRQINEFNNFHRSN